MSTAESKRTLSQVLLCTELRSVAYVQALQPQLSVLYLRFVRKNILQARIRGE